MKQFIIKESAWALIAFAAFGLLSLATETKEPLVIGMLVYAAVKASYLYGLHNQITRNNESRRH